MPVRVAINQLASSAFSLILPLYSLPVNFRFTSSGSGSWSRLESRELELGLLHSKRHLETDSASARWARVEGYYASRLSLPFQQL